MNTFLSKSFLYVWRSLLACGLFALYLVLLFVVIRSVPVLASIPVDAVELHIEPASTAATPSQPLAISFQEVVSGLERPVDIQNAGDQRLFVIEKPGRIRVIDHAGNLVGSPFLDIESLIDDESNEEGLLGMAFHPNYAATGHVYVNYTVNNPPRTRISRFTVSSTNANIADADSEVVLIEFGQPRGNHNGGQVQFGPDGYLYIATGDSGGGGDPDNAGQDQTQLLGKILRIDVDSSGGSGPECEQSGNSNYTIPPSNPFVADADGKCDEIWATGLRNPWRFSFDAVTGDMWIGDVGQNSREEINFQPGASAGGENYGWRCYEGDEAFDTSGCQSAAAYVTPAHDYDRDDGCSVTGGMVYRGSSFSELVGHYFFTDYCRSTYWTLSGNPLAPTLTTLDVEGGSASHPTAFGADLNGELYVASDNGIIFRIMGQGDTITPIPPNVNPRFLPLIAVP